jgi:CheY-like chemotaxis protein
VALTAVQADNHFSPVSLIVPLSAIVSGVALDVEAAFIIKLAESKQLLLLLRNTRCPPSAHHGDLRPAALMPKWHKYCSRTDMMPKVLVVEDHPEDVKPILRAWLEGFDLIYETRTDQVSHRLRSHPDVGVVLLDLHFDGQHMQGADVVRAIKLSHPSLPVIILATKGDVALAQQLKEESKSDHSFVKDELRQDEFVQRVKIAVQAGLRQKKLEGLRVVFLDSKRQIVIDEIQLRLITMQYALYRTVARAAKEQWPGVGPQGFGGRGWLAYSDFFDPRTRAAQEFVMLWSGHNLKQAAQTFHELMQCAGDGTRLDDNRDYYRDKIRKLLSPCVSHINRELERNLRDPGFVEKCKIHQVTRQQNEKPMSTFGLLLSSPDITFRK